MDADTPGAGLPRKRNDAGITPRNSQARHQCTSESGADHVDDRAQAAVFAGHLRQLEATRRECAVKHAAIGTSLGGHKEAFARNQLRPNAGKPIKRVTGRQQQDQFVRTDALAVQAAIRWRLREGKTQVQRAIPHRFTQHTGASYLHVELQPRMLALEVGQHRRQPMRAQGFQRPDS